MASAVNQPCRRIIASLAWKMPLRHSRFPLAQVLDLLQGMPEKLYDHLLVGDRAFELGDLTRRAVGRRTEGFGFPRTASLTEVGFASFIHPPHPLVEQFAMDSEFPRQRGNLLTLEYPPNDLHSEFIAIDAHLSGRSHRFRSHACSPESGGRRRQIACCNDVNWITQTLQPYEDLRIRRQDLCGWL